MENITSSLRRVSIIDQSKERGEGLVKGHVRLHSTDALLHRGRKYNANWGVGWT